MLAAHAKSVPVSPRLLAAAGPQHFFPLDNQLVLLFTGG